MTVHICYLRSCFFSLFHKMSKWIFGEMSVIDLCNIDWPTQWLTKALNRSFPKKANVMALFGGSFYHILSFSLPRSRNCTPTPTNPAPPPPFGNMSVNSGYRRTCRLPIQLIDTLNEPIPHPNGMQSLWLR